MGDCCSPKGYRWVFSEREARREANRYRRRGLDSTSRRIVDFVKAQGVDGRTVLEVGGGVGAIQLELLRAGASKAVSVELTPTYEQVAIELVRQAGFAEKVERKVMDFAQANGQVESADIVIMNRVVCCYPDMPRLVGAAAGHARQLLVMTFPRASWWMRLGLGITNFILWAARREFHVFVHPPAKISATSEEHGLSPAFDQRGLVWAVAAFRRAGSSSALQ